MSTETASPQWTLTPDGDDLIVDCDEHGEIGRVMASYHPAAPDRDERGRALHLYEQHVAREHDA